MKPKIVRYPIPGNDCGGTLHIHGDKNARKVILYCGGFPDGLEPFTPLAQRLATSKGDDDDGCLVGITCWPGFDYESFNETKFRGFRREGYNFEEVTCCIREAATRLFVEYNKTTEGDNISNKDKHKKPQFTVIFHDWGVIPGLMFVNRSIEEKYFTQHKPDRIVLLDVLVEPHRKFNTPSQHQVSYSKRELLVCVAYRSALASSFAMLHFISESMGLITLCILCNLVKVLGLSPIRRIDDQLIAGRKINLHHLVYMSYPYYYLFRAMINRRSLPLAHASLPLDLLETPVLYMYGPDKNVMFHDHQSVAILEREEREGRSDCRVVKVEGAGHWVYCQRPDVCEQEIRKFMKSGNNVMGDVIEDENGNPKSKP